ncbi:hypothetical protein [Desulfobulbus oligotrophicus]|jgi:cation transporter-like permease|uniref:Uncharacterized protein n=1 Tax=Desulfobulbus oligotrophicus TaxID=1909699 RepID=A0A7T5VBG2_9BACT|nr:hypothetical protein [Desulfobulbus oligotrophicus]MDY0390524.1 hypothetical protein [Desulfobulbus oligotrophicus]QQG64815.1 hypothetical protein HP555_02520 [Desulfobulbus oligotrophicus]
MSEYTFFLFHKLLVTAVNLLVLGALFIAMYRASLYPDEFTPIFFSTLFTLFGPIFLLGYIGKRYLNKRRPVLA